ncbi:MAG: hypothetical protein IPO56_16300 [Flavobacteriales bacterium]|nr:hypothetical protein [Flavobacteriales bacterium]
MFTEPSVREAEIIALLSGTKSNSLYLAAYPNSCRLPMSTEVGVLSFIRVTDGRELMRPCIRDSVGSIEIKDVHDGACIVNTAIADRLALTEITIKH